MGLEPTRPIGHKILSLACLPISAPPRDLFKIQHLQLFVNKDFSISGTKKSEPLIIRNSDLYLLRRMGLEPTRPTGHKILSLACLPISAPPRDLFKIQYLNRKVKKKLSHRLDIAVY